MYNWQPFMKRAYSELNFNSWGRYDFREGVLRYGPGCGEHSTPDNLLNVVLPKWDFQHSEARQVVIMCLF